MELILTGALVLLAALSWWQALLQNNVALFQKRIELYQDFSRKFHYFINEAESLNSSHLFHIAKTTNEEGMEGVMGKLVERYSYLEGAIDSMMFVGFSEKINNLLLEVKSDANVITDFLTETKRRKSNFKHRDCTQALKNVNDFIKVGSELNILFNAELPLRNFKFYVCKYLSKICSHCCGCK